MSISPNCYPNSSVNTSPRYSRLAKVGFILSLVNIILSIPVVIVVNAEDATFNQKIMGVLFVFFVVAMIWTGIIISHIAHHKVKKYHLKGRWMAITGFTIGYVLLFFHYGLQGLIEIFNEYFG